MDCPCAVAAWIVVLELVLGALSSAVSAATRHPSRLFRNPTHRIAHTLQLERLGRHAPDRHTSCCVFAMSASTPQNVQVAAFYASLEFFRVRCAQFAAAHEAPL